LKALVLGRGVSGRGAEELLRELGFGVEFYEDGMELPNSFDFAVKSPGFSPEHRAVKEVLRRGKPLYGEVELAYRFMAGRIVGVTGTNGKSTTTALIYYGLKAAGEEAFIGGNYGVPASSFALKTGESSTSVLELSSFQIEDLKSFRGDVGAILNITPDHLNRYPSFKSYVDAKLKMLNHFDFKLLNRDDEILREVRGEGILYFGRERGGDFFFDGESLRDLSGAKIEVGELPLKGVHNIENYLCAFGVLRVLGLKEEEIYAGFKEFKGLPHRTEEVGRVGSVIFINDSKSTNIDSLKKALLSFERVVLIAGGSDKGLDFTPLRPIVKERVEALVAIGETAGKLEEAFSGVTAVRRAQSLEEAVEEAFRAAREVGAPVLLSPGCASFDMFSNYKERGEAFKRAVKLLEERFG